MPLSLFVFLTQPEVELLLFGLQQNKPMMLHTVSFTLISGSRSRPQPCVRKALILIVVSLWPASLGTLLSGYWCEGVLENTGGEVKNVLIRAVEEINPVALLSRKSLTVKNRNFPTPQIFFFSKFFG